MKRILLTLIVSAAALSSARAFTVYDPAVHSSIILQTSQEIAKFVSMINNQVSQIRTLTDQLDEFKDYKKLFGDPKAVLLATAGPLLSDLRQSELGQSFGAIVSAADGADALVYNARGLYHSIGAGFTTPKGHTVPRNKNEFRPFAAINSATANYQIVSTNAAARRTELKAQIAATIEQLRSADDAAEVAKLSGVLTGLSAALTGTEQEANQSLAPTLGQDIETRNDERKQARALKEKQSAAFSEALGNYGKTFRLLDAPTTFPK